MFQLASICEPVCARADTLVEETPWTGVEQKLQRRT
jgi:hypothetical protein